MVHAQTLDPVWHEKFAFHGTLARLTQDKLKVSVYDSDNLLTEGLTYARPYILPPSPYILPPSPYILPPSPYISPQTTPIPTAGGSSQKS